MLPSSSLRLASSVPYVYTVPDLSVTSHVYVFGVVPLRTILANPPSIRVWKTLSPVLRATAGPRFATGVNSAPLSRYVSVSLAESYRGTPHRVSTTIAGVVRSQPTPSQPFSAAESYDTAIDGCIPARPAGSVIG